MVSFKKRDDLARFFGVLKDIDWDEKEKAIKELRGSFKKGQMIRENFGAVK